MGKTPQEVYADSASGRLSHEEYLELRQYAESVANLHFKPPSSPEPFLTQDMFKVIENNNHNSGHRGRKKRVR